MHYLTHLASTRLPLVKFMRGVAVLGLANKLRACPVQIRSDADAASMGHTFGGM
jgi:hypothetical protein